MAEELKLNIAERSNGMKQRKRCFLYRLLVIASLSTGIVFNLATTDSIQLLLSYYTMLSNLLCLVAFILFLIGDFKQYNYRESDLYYAMKGMIVITILVTCIVYATTLLPKGFSMNVESEGIAKQIGNLLVHFISPILVLIDYFLWDEKGNFKFFYPIIWLFFPIQYVCYVYLHKAGGGHFYSIGGSRDFGYFFLDYREIGVKGVIGWISVIVLGIILVGYILVGIDKRLAKNKSSKV